MLHFLFGIFVVLHGLVHLWYFTLSQRLVEFKPEMGWTGRSWILSNFLSDATTRFVASILFVLAAIAFVVSGVGIFGRTGWWWSMLLGSAVFSSAIIFLLWDGNMRLVVQKGLVGFLINVAILLVLLLFKRSTFALDKHEHLTAISSRILSSVYALHYYSYPIHLTSKNSPIGWGVFLLFDLHYKHQILFWRKYYAS